MNEVNLLRLLILDLWLFINLNYFAVDHSNFSKLLANVCLIRILTDVPPYGLVAIRSFKLVKYYSLIDDFWVQQAQYWKVMVF